MPPRLMVITWAPWSTAQSIALATETWVIRNTLSTARIAISEAPGAVPVTVPAGPDTTTLAVAVPCPGFAPSSGSVGSASSSSTSNPGTTLMSASSAWAVMPVSGWATTVPVPRAGRWFASENVQASGAVIDMMAQAAGGLASAGAQHPVGKPSASSSTNSSDTMSSGNRSVGRSGSAASRSNTSWNRCAAAKAAPLGPANAQSGNVATRTPRSSVDSGSIVAPIGSSTPAIAWARATGSSSALSTNANRAGCAEVPGYR